jgi:hypothetical protein
VKLPASARVPTSTMPFVLAPNRTSCRRFVPLDVWPAATVTRSVPAPVGAVWTTTGGRGVQLTGGVGDGDGDGDGEGDGEGDGAGGGGGACPPPATARAALTRP